MNEKTLFKRIGGEVKVSAAVSVYFRKVLRDDTLAPFFDGVDMDALSLKQIASLTVALGGPSNYTGKDMREAHKVFVEKGMNQNDFNAVAGYLKATLKELKVPGAEIDEIMSIVSPIKAEALIQ